MIAWFWLSQFLWLKCLSQYYQLFCGRLTMISMIWSLWLGGRKSIRPVKTSNEVLVWLSVWNKVQMTCIWSSWCRCHPVISASENLEWFILVVLAHQGCHGKRPLNDCMCGCMYVPSHFSIMFSLVSVSRLEDKESETRKEYSKLHERYTDVRTRLLWNICSK